jgi:hypothetical protein
MADDLKKGPASSSMAAATGLVAERAARLERQLAERDQLVQALTDQLELAAEQLDRMQRSGTASRRGGSGGSGLPSDLVADHKQMVEDLQRVTQQWEDMQAGLTLGRIEVQLTELRDFVGQRLTPGAFISGANGASSRHTSPADESQLTDAGAVVEASTESVWESLKSEMLGDEAVPAGAPASRTLEPIVPADAPAAIDIKTATLEEMADAISERESYICYLLQMLRTRTEVPVPPDWSALNNAPEELTARLERMAADLQDNLRRADVEISIERARLAREQAQLAMREEQLKRQMRELGIEQEAAVSHEKRGGKGNAPDRRWSRFLGINRET